MSAAAEMLAEFAALVQDRAAQCLQPDDGAVDAAALQGAGDDLALAQVLPELLIVRRLDVQRFAQHAVMLADQLFATVAQHAQGNCHWPAVSCHRQRIPEWPSNATMHPAAHRALATQILIILRHLTWQITLMIKFAGERLLAPHTAPVAR
jgi:hypothetical protein